MKVGKVSWVASACPHSEGAAYKRQAVKSPRACETGGWGRSRVWISLGLRTERHDFLTITAREVCPEPRQSIALVEGA